MNQINEGDNFEYIRQVYRASSPTITRQENRIKELEELLDLERDTRKRLERTNIELDEQLETVANQVDECSVSSSQYNEAIRRRDSDIQRLRKELEKLSLNMEMSEQGLRKKNHLMIADLKTEIENLQKQRIKSEKDKMSLMKELESALVQCDAVTKQKITVESRMENAESQLLRIKGIVDNLERQVTEMSSQKSMLGEENGTLKITIKEVTHQNNTLRKSKSSLELQLDEIKKVAEEEIRLRENLQSQNHMLHSDNEQMKLQLEHEAECHHRIQQQLAKVNGEVSLLKSKYDKDISERTAEFEELRRKSATKINELTEEASREHIKVNSLEKTRQQLAMEVGDLNAELERLEVEVETLQHNLKSLENANNELNNQLEELGMIATSLRMANAKMSSENSRLRMNIEEEEIKNSSLAKNNNILTSQLKDEKELCHAVTKELTEVQSIRNQLEQDRMNLLSALDETKEMLTDTERKYQSSHAALLQLRTDMEQRLLEKNEELESLRKTSQRTIEELSSSLTELETKYKSELAKLKKKYEVQCKQLQDNLELVQRENGELTDELQETSVKLQEVEHALDDERHDLQLIQEKLSSSERRRLQLQGDLEDSNRLLEAADKSRKNTQMEIELISMKSADCAAQINSLSNDKRKLENEVAALKADIEDMTVSKIDYEERAAKLANEANVLMDDLRQEQENNRKGEAVRKNVVLELKETKSKLDQRESLAVKEMARNSQVYQDRIRDLESELEAERVKGKEVQISMRKQDRIMKELQQQADDERNTTLELQHQFEAAQAKLRQYKRQMDELETVNAETLSKYRRAQKQIDETDHRPGNIDRRSTLNSYHCPAGTSTITQSSHYSTTGAR